MLFSSKRLKLWLAAVALCLLLAVGGQQAAAQIRGGWSIPLQLSTPGRAIADPLIISDDYGYVHVLWVEMLPDNRSVLQYARYDGQTWSPSVDIRVTRPDTAISSPSVSIDENNIMHVAWIEGLAGPAYYTFAPAHNALNARHWSEPRTIRIPAVRLILRVDAAGTLHLIFSVSAEGQYRRGIYYTQSKDEGVTWSPAYWIDPDIPPDFAPNQMQFELDSEGGLHVMWFYGNVAHASENDWIRYARSLDGGQSWSLPFTLARNQEGAPELGGASRPVMAVNGSQVHVVWAGGDLLYRHHRYSVDRGSTWSTEQQIFGELNGQAREDLIADQLGRIHYFGQIRYPQGIYHAYWDGEHWSTPELIYLIVNSAADTMPAGIIHAHDTHPAIRAGNEIFLTLADPPPEPGRRLFITSRKLDDLAPLAVQPTPTATPVSEPTATPTVTPPPPTATPPQFAQDPPQETPSPGSPIALGVAAPLLLVFLAATVVAFARYRHP